jgi:hypothetical protein
LEHRGRTYRVGHEAGHRVADELAHVDGQPEWRPVESIALLRTLVAFIDAARVAP